MLSGGGGVIIMWPFQMIGNLFRRLAQLLAPGDIALKKFTIRL